MTSVKGWGLWEMPEGTYEIGSDNTVTHSGKQSGFVSAKNGGGKFGAIMQKVSATAFKGQRIEFAAFIKCQGVREHCGLFMEVFDSNSDVSGSMLAMDNMKNRPVSGSTEWTKYSIVLDIDDDSYGINIGARLFGPGKMWLDGVTFEAVGEEVATTHEWARRRYAAAPQNLAFDQD